MPEITIESLLMPDPIYGLWHGTRAEVKGGLQAGETVLRNPKPLIDKIWQLLCSEKGIALEKLYSEDVSHFFTTKSSLDRAVDIGNSIRYIKNQFEYDVTAFATTKFAAKAFAESGSELASAIIALVDASRLEYDNRFDAALPGELQTEIEQFYTAAKTLLSGPPRLYRLVRIPPAGQFFLPGYPEESITAFPIPYDGYSPPPEVFFRGEIPPECWEE